MFLYRMFGSLFFFFKQKTAYEMRISDWSSDVCSSDLTQRTAVLAIADKDTTKLMLGASLGDLRLALHGQAEEDARLAAATNGTAPAPNAETAATTASATQSTAKAGAANTQPDKAITSEELGRIKQIGRAHV